MQPAQPTLSFQPALAQQLAREAALPVGSCYQCRKCSAGCPLTFAMDLLPDQVIRLATLGQLEPLLTCRTIWVCASCVTCTTRCPNGIDIARVMDWLKEEALKRGKAVAQPEIATVQRLFLDTIRRQGGRLSEMQLIGRYSLYKLRQKPDLRAMLEDAKLGWKLFRRRRLRLRKPPALRGKAEIRQILQRAGV